VASALAHKGCRDAHAMDAVVKQMKPEAVVDEATSLPKHYNKRKCEPQPSATAVSGSKADETFRTLQADPS
jgi:hypothetical protein